MGVATALGLAITGAFRAEPDMPIGLLTGLTILSSIVAFLAVRARLRDLGLSYWQVRLAFAALLLVAIAVAAGFDVEGRLAAIGCACVLAFALTVLGAIPGQAKTNRFGPQPSF